jgi:gamma-glutamyl phosphate reductase
MMIWPWHVKSMSTCPVVDVYTNYGICHTYDDSSPTEEESITVIKHCQTRAPESIHSMEIQL